MPCMHKVRTTNHSIFKRARLYRLKGAIILGLRDFFEEIKIYAEGIINDTKLLNEEVRELFTETKRDIIADWKREIPPVGNTVDKIDKAITTIKNVKEHLPGPSPGSFNPQHQLRKLFKETAKISNAISTDSVQKAMHLKVNRFGYSHHALAISDYEVIHFQNGEVVLDLTEDFAKGGTIHIVNTPRLYNKDEVIVRAYSKLGNKDYNLIFNNCEHFVQWCLNGD